MFVKSQHKTVGPKAVAGVKWEKFEKKFPFSSEKTDPESESGSSTTKTSNGESDTENRSHRKWCQWQKIITAKGKECLEKSPISGSTNLLYSSC